MARDYTDDGIDPESGLTLRERLAVDHYLLTLNKTKAYHAAGYTAENYAAARANASRLFANDNVKAYLDVKIKERRERLSVSADATLKAACVVAFSDVTDFRINPDTGEVEVKPGRPREMTRAVKSVKASRQTRVLNRPNGETETIHTWTGEILLWDKMKAIELLAKHCGLVHTELPPMEVMLARLPPVVANIMRKLLSGPPEAYAVTPEEMASLEDKPPEDE
jgi:phage terminase small subunit